MSHIKVGMLVEIIDTSTFIRGRESIGHVGRVLSFWGRGSSGKDCWDISGTDTATVAFVTDCLRPINPDSEPAEQDFQEDLKRWLGEKVTA